MREQLQQLVPDATLHVSRDSEDARKVMATLARESRVVLVGGDGTVHQLLPEILRGGHTLGLVPFGSGNDTARAMGLLDLSPRDALKHALQAPAQAIDIAFADTDTGISTPFISSLAVGFDAAIALRAHKAPKWLIGLPRYLYATFLELGALKRNEVSLIIDDEVVPEAPRLFTSVLNTATFGSGMPAVPHARVNDGELNLLIAGEFGRMGALLMLPRLLMGNHLSHPRVQTRAFKTLTISSPAALPLAADGEPLPLPRSEAKRIQVRVAPAAIRFVAKALSSK
jgi:diacylglycerol kinase family enzyme